MFAKLKNSQKLKETSFLNKNRQLLKSVVHDERNKLINVITYM